MRKLGCRTNVQRSCCTVEYCPLVPAWATTIHKFQGFEAGKDDTDRIKQLIVDPGDIAWEQQCPGALYVALSRAKTMGDGTSPPQNSAIYWSSDGMSKKRVTDGSLRWDQRRRGHKIDCALIQKRNNWVQHLQTKAGWTTTKSYSNKQLDRIEQTTYQQAVQGLNLDGIKVLENIATRIQHPHPQWAKNRRQYLKQKSFFQ